ncbi:hypothetical protein BamMEX5DRAFT_7101 [Burkholderia ambifaria MEX-5]|uniref:Uncharacterized protein n=1 Tax=Burkholderia ambifaria MEX-5 TaxID=396597 RepID=B1TH34_9BURK|nr:hypothetical protein BamMEX5DRAFT_7101 [Burkholderia ambifaria MEX-5]
MDLKMVLPSFTKMLTVYATTVLCISMIQTTPGFPGPSHFLVTEMYA